MHTERKQKHIRKLTRFVYKNMIRKRELRKREKERGRETKEGKRKVEKENNKRKKYVSHE
jgi:hypothetical protein